ncbi:hydantoinase/oxoprolinase family protein [Agromyces bauzanensis]
MTLEAVTAPTTRTDGEPSANRGRYTIDIDTGGTFTDGFIADHQTGRIVLSKVPSTPHDPSQSLLDCTAFAAAELGISQRDLLQGAGVFRYSSTISTNAIIEHRGLRVGLLVAEGTEPALALSGERRPLVDQGFLRPELVDAVAVPEGGEPDPASVVATFQRLVEAGAQTVLIAFAGSGRDDAAERGAKRAIRTQYPAHYLGAAPVFTTAEIVSGGDDALRVNTAFLAAYVHHHLARYLFRAEERLRAAGLTRPLLVVHADGGVTRVAKTHALDTYNSGPVSGLQGARALAERRGDDLAVTVDMGGTSVDIGVIAGAVLPQVLEWELAGLPVRLPTVRVEAVGGAGGSIARVVDGEVRVGPDSAGARPGPACFGLGGTLPTVTDADLVLGYVDPAGFLGGRMRLDRARAEAAVSSIAEQLGVDVVEAAWRIKDAVDRQSADEIATHLAAARADGASGATLLLYGGAGPVHGGGILAHAGARRAVMTRTASVFSAFSSASMDVLHQYPAPTPEAIGSDAAAWASSVAGALPELVARAERDMRGEGFAAGSLRYRLHALGQAADGRSVSVRVPVDADAEAAAAELHRALAEAGAEVQLLSLEASAGVPHHELTAEPLGGEDAADAIVGEREAFWGPEVGLATAPVYARDRLLPGNALEGPALVQGSDTTIVVPPGQRLTVDEWNDDILTISEGGAR